MTAQISDFVEYNNNKYAIVAIQNDWPFSPENYGITPIATSSANYRGYFCDYAIKEGALILEELFVGQDENNIPTFNGVTAIKNRFYRINHIFEYKDVGLPVNYSGGIIIGNDFIEEFYVHMGFHRAHCYKYVKEIIFENGNVIKVIDHSEKMEKVREKIRKINDTSGDVQNSEKNIMQFIEDSFSRSYNKKWTST